MRWSGSSVIRAPADGAIGRKRDEDRRLLKRYALKFFPADLRVGHVGPRLVSEFIGWLVKQQSQRGGPLSDKSVKNALQPVSACLATARREGLIEL
jgi:hypothetical protein